MLTRSCLKLNFVCICPTCSNRRSVIEVGRRDTKGSGIEGVNASKVAEMRKTLKEGFCECKQFTVRPTREAKTCIQCNRMFSLAFFNSDQTIGSGTFVDEENKPIEHPKTGLRDQPKQTGVTFRKYKLDRYGNKISEYPEFPETMEGLFTQVKPGQLVCSFCQIPVSNVVACLGQSGVRQVQVRELDRSVDPPVIRVRTVHSTDRLVACPDHAYHLMVRDSSGKVVRNKLSTYDEG